MADKEQKETTTCPFCGGVLEIGCLMGKDSFFAFQWYEGEPTFWKNLIPHGDPVGELRSMVEGAYLKGVRCQSCRRMILEY
jgi:hypothetical protein